MYKILISHLIITTARSPIIGSADRMIFIMIVRCAILAKGNRAWRRTRDCLRESAIWNDVAVPLRDLGVRCQLSERRVPPSN